VVANLVRLYKALGGGWSALSPAEGENATKGMQ
jgi:outer membrane protein TolC